MPETRVVLSFGLRIRCTYSSKRGNETPSSSLVLDRVFLTDGALIALHRRAFGTINVCSVSTAAGFERRTRIARMRGR